MEKEFQMKEEIKLFVQKLAADEDLQQKLQACKTPEEAYAIASSVQEGFTLEEFVEAMQKLRDATEKELTDEDLAKAAGGNSDTVVKSLVVSSVNASLLAAAAF